MRRNSFRRDSFVSEDPNQGSEQPHSKGGVQTEQQSEGEEKEKEKEKEGKEKEEGSSTVIVGSLPDISDDKDTDDRSVSPTHSVESYESDEEVAGKTKADEDEDEREEEGNEKSAVDDEGGGDRKGSAIRVCNVAA